MRRRPILAVVSLVSVFVVVDLALLPWSDINDLDRSRPKVTAFQQAYVDQERAAGRKGSFTKRWKSIGEISGHLIASVIVAEDGTFWSHEGFDWFEVQESLLRNIKEQRAARGASTITQQLIKNLYLSPSKNPLRKYHEFLLTWYAERVLTKKRILELYLNEIEWGRGVYGAEAAAQKYFRVGADLLDRDQSARLAAVIPNPRRFDPTSGSRAVERRTDIILRRLQVRDRVRGRVEEPLPDPAVEEEELAADQIVPPVSADTTVQGLPNDTTEQDP